MKLRDSVVLITGASSGIGAATAVACSQRGARVVLAARSADKLAALADCICNDGGQALTVPTDVGNRSQVEQLVARAGEHFGRIDVLVNSAGFAVFDQFQQADPAHLDEMLQVNLRGNVYATQAVLPQMLARRHGQLVNIASLAGLVASRNFAFYNASKFALVGMSRALQIELAGSGVNCAVICPGPVRTPFFVRAELAKFGRMSGLMPWLDAADVARSIVQTIENDRTGEICIPPITQPFVTALGAFPALMRWASRFILRP